MPEPIDQLCLNPWDTRRRAASGEAVPCYRCLAYRPGAASGCHFLEIVTVAPVTRKKRRHVTQLTLPTNGTIRGDDE